MIDQREIEKAIAALPEKQRRLFDRTFDPTLELVLPAGWEKAKSGADGAAYRNDHGLYVIISGIEIDHKRWIHVSVSRKSRLPSWSDLKVVKNLFIGLEKKALQVLPAHKEYVNLHPYCLHLWHCLDGDSVPDFRLGTGTI